jgi:hypothetical protein
MTRRPAVPRPLLGPAVLVALLCAGAAPTAAAQSACTPRRGTHISIRTDHDERRTMRFADATRCLEVRSVGEVRFTDDDADVAQLAPGGSVTVEETTGGVTRRAEFTERGGAVLRRFAVDGRPADDGRGRRVAARGAAAGRARGRRGRRAARGPGAPPARRARRARRGGGDLERPREARVPHHAPRRAAAHPRGAREVAAAPAGRSRRTPTRARCCAPWWSRGAARTPSAPWWTRGHDQLRHRAGARARRRGRAAGATAETRAAVAPPPGAASAATAPRPTCSPGSRRR